MDNILLGLSISPILLLFITYVYTEQMDAEGLGRRLLLTPSGDPGRAPENANPASTFELSQCRHCKEGLPGPRRRFWVLSGSLSPKTAAPICTL